MGRTRTTPRDRASVPRATRHAGLTATMALALAPAAACQKTPTPSPQVADVPQTPAPEPAAPAAAEGPAAIEGALWDASSKRYIEVCEGGCPRLLHAQATAHCEATHHGNLKWSLPTRAEAKRFAKLEALNDRKTFHWTQTPYAEDDAQRWIVDPSSGMETTVPPTRKPFEVRCVAPAAASPAP